MIDLGTGNNNKVCAAPARALHCVRVLSLLVLALQGCSLGFLCTPRLNQLRASCAADQLGHERQAGVH